MQAIKFFLVFAFISFCFFYFGAVVVCATVYLDKMDVEVRRLVFGAWMVVVIIVMLSYTVHKLKV